MFTRWAGLVLLFLLFPLLAIAGPYLACDPYTGQEIIPDGFRGMVNGQEFDMPYSLHTSGAAIVYDCSALGSGKWEFTNIRAYKHVPGKPDAESDQVAFLWPALPSALVIIGTQSDPPAVTFDSVSSASASSVTHLSFSHTVGPSADYLVVGVSSRDTVSGGNSLPSMATYGGIAMTRLGTIINTANRGNRVTMFGLSSPVFGANNVIVTMPGTCARMGAGAMSFAGVGSVRPFVGATGNISKAQASISSATGEIVIGVLCTYASSFSSAVGQNERYRRLIGGSYNCAGATKEGASSVAMSWTITGSSPGWALGLISLMPRVN